MLPLTGVMVTRGRVPVGASAAAGHGAGCWHLHLMPSGQGAPFRSAAAGWAAVTGTAPAGGEGRDGLVRWGERREKTAVLQSTERKDPMMVT